MIKALESILAIHLEEAVWWILPWFPPQSALHCTTLFFFYDLHTVSDHCPLILNLRQNPIGIPGKEWVQSS